MSAGTAAVLNPIAIAGHNMPPPLAEILGERYGALLAEIEPIADRAASLPRRITDDIALGRLGDVVKDARKLAKRIDAQRGAEVEPHLTAQRETNAFFRGQTERLDAIVKPLEAIATDYQRAKAAEERRILAEQARKAREEEDRQRAMAEAAAARERHGAAMRHDDHAEEAAERARRTEGAAARSAADLTRVRSGSGTVATARQTWTFTIEDLAAVPLDVLRPYLAREAIEKAVSSYVRIHKGAGKLAGVSIFQDTKAAFR